MDVKVGNQLWILTISILQMAFEWIYYFDDMYAKRNEDIFQDYFRITNRSHYVKRQYLAGWSKDGKRVLTSMNGGDFSLKSLKNICVQKHMYKMEKLTELELFQLRTFYKDSPPAVQEMNDRFLSRWQMFCSMGNLFDDSKMKELTNKMMIQAGEDLQTNFESGLSSEINDCLLECREVFWEMVSFFAILVFIFSANS